MRTASTLAEQRVVLESVSWETYLSLSDGADVQRGLMAYDEGMLEIMSPSLEHERCAELLGMLIAAACEWVGIEITSAGSTT